MAKRDSKGRFLKSGAKRSGGAKRKRSAAIVKRSGGAVVVVGNRSPARRRRSGGGGGGRGIIGGGLSRYLGGVRGDDLLASGGLGLAVNKSRATVETLVNYAPDMMAPLGAYGIIAVMAGLGSHFGVGRRVLSPIARVASIIAANKIGTRGGLFASKVDSLSGDDGGDGVGDDYIDVSGLETLEGDEPDDGGIAGDDIAGDEPEDG